MPLRSCNCRTRRGFDIRACKAACSCCLMASNGSSLILEAMSLAVFAFCTAMKFLWVAPSCGGRLATMTCRNMVDVPSHSHLRSESCLRASFQEGNLPGRSGFDWSPSQALNTSIPISLFVSSLFALLANVEALVTVSLPPFLSSIALISSFPRARGKK